MAQREKKSRGRKEKKEEWGEAEEGGGQNTVFPLHGFILIFTVALHTESKDVSENRP